MLESRAMRPLAKFLFKLLGFERLVEEQIEARMHADWARNEKRLNDFRKAFEARLREIGEPVKDYKKMADFCAGLVAGRPIFDVDPEALLKLEREREKVMLEMQERVDSREHRIQTNTARARNRAAFEDTKRMAKTLGLNPEELAKNLNYHGYGQTQQAAEPVASDKVGE